MKIGLFSDSYRPSISGVVISVDTLAKEFMKQGHEVIVITNEHDYAEDEKNVIRYKGARLPMKGLKEYRIHKVTKKKVHEIGKLELDIIHCHTEFTIGRLGRKVARMYNIPVVHTYHTMYEDYIHFVTKLFYYPLRWIAKKYSKKFASSVDEVIFPTVKVKDKFDEYGFRKNSHIIPTGIYLDRFNIETYDDTKISSFKNEYKIDDTKLNLLFLGRMSREKSVDVLLKEYKKLSLKHDDIHLLLVGGGPDLEYFKTLSTGLDLDDRVTFTGMVSPDVVGCFYHLGDIFVNFSTTETQGLTYIEALAANLPIIVKYDTNLEGVIFEGVNGYSFNNDNEFIPLIEKLKEDKNLVEKLALNARATADDFSALNYANKVLNIYDELLKK